MIPSGRSISIGAMLREPALFVWSCYLLLTPFYLVRGGLPQPGDFLILVLVPLAMYGWDGRLATHSIRVLRPLLLFTLWVCLVGLAWAVILWSWGFNLLYPVYYVYNTAFFLAALILYRRYGDPFLRLTVQLIFITVIFQVAASFVMPGGARGRVFFHNPNQLGYYALLAACVLALSHRRLGISLLRSSLGLVCCGYLALLSASRSSAAGIAFLLALLLFANPRVLLVAAIASAGLTLVDTPIDSSVETLQKRVGEDRNPNRSFLEERGYDRIWNNKVHVVLGAAEGNMDRWIGTSMLGGAEIHSSIGTLIFCYGIPGVTLFVLFLWRLMRGVQLRLALVLFPALLYSAAHQGLRFTMLWVLFALYCALKDVPAQPPRSVRV